MEHFDKNGEPISFERWIELMERPEYRVIAQERVAGDVDVSTVWLGHELFSYGSNRRCIFETMIFGGPLNGWQHRSATEAEAVFAHARNVFRAQAADASLTRRTKARARRARNLSRRALLSFKRSIEADPYRIGVAFTLRAILRESPRESIERAAKLRRRGGARRMFGPVETPRKPT